MYSEFKGENVYSVYSLYSVFKGESVYRGESVYIIGGRVCIVYLGRVYIVCIRERVCIVCIRGR